MGDTTTSRRSCCRVCTARDGLGPDAKRACASSGDGRIRRSCVRHAGDRRRIRFGRGASARIAACRASGSRFSRAGSRWGLRLALASRRDSTPRRQGRRGGACAAARSGAPHDPGRPAATAAARSATPRDRAAAGALLLVVVAVDRDSSGRALGERPELGRLGLLSPRRIGQVLDVPDALFQFVEHGDAVLSAAALLVARTPCRGSIEKSDAECMRRVGNNLRGRQDERRPELCRRLAIASVRSKHVK